MAQVFPGHDANPGDCQQLIPDTIRGSISCHGRTWGVCCFAPYALAEVVAAKHKGPEVDSLWAFVCGCDTGYSAAGTTEAALAALAALFFARLILAQRFC